MKDNTYTVIQSWMRSELNLSGNELIVYAVIYGFSQGEDNKYTGSRQYLADWCGCSVRQVQTILNNLADRGLLTKEEGIVNNVKVCRYVANFTTGEKTSPGTSEETSLPGEKISLYNIDNNTKTDNTKVLSNKKSNSKKNLFEKCSMIILNYTDDEELRKELFDYLKMRLSASKEFPVFASAFYRKLLSLDDLTQSVAVKCQIVRQTTTRGWVNFFPLNSAYSKNTDPTNENGVVTSTRITDTKGDIPF